MRTFDQMTVLLTKSSLARLPFAYSSYVGLHNISFSFSISSFINSSIHTGREAELEFDVCEPERVPILTCGQWRFFFTFPLISPTSYFTFPLISPTYYLDALSQTNFAQYYCDSFWSFCWEWMFYLFVEWQKWHTSGYIFNLFNQIYGAKAVSHAAIFLLFLWRRENEKTILHRKIGIRPFGLTFGTSAIKSNYKNSIWYDLKWRAICDFINKYESPLLSNK